MIQRYHYPGDPPGHMRLLSGRAFREENPDRTIRIASLDPTEPEIVIPVEDVICDLCNAGIADDEICGLTYNRLYCAACVDKYYRPYFVR